MSYSKLHSSLVNSSLWTEPDNVRILFITLLAMCDRQGYVYGSRPGIERLANIDPDDSGTAWNILMSSDKHSSDLLRNPENEGRRIEEVPGGFRLLNFEYYRGLRNDDDRREQTRRAVAKHRSSKPEKASVSQGKPGKADESHCKQIPSASVSVSVQKNKEEKKERGIDKGDDDLEWITGLRDDPAYKGIDVAREHAKMTNWCRVNKKQPTRKRFVNWLNRVERPLDVQFKAGSKTVKYVEPPPIDNRTPEQVEAGRKFAADEVEKLRQKFRMPDCEREAAS